jgi:Na+/serine symporter
MQPYSKRMLAYFAIAILGAIFVHEDLFFLAPVLIFIDLTQDIVRSRYQDFKDEQQKIIKDLSK